MMTSSLLSDHRLPTRSGQFPCSRFVPDVLLRRVPAVPPVSRVPQVRRDSRASQALKVSLDLRERWESTDRRDQGEQRETGGKWECQVRAYSTLALRDLSCIFLHPSRFPRYQRHSRCSGSPWTRGTKRSGRMQRNRREWNEFTTFDQSHVLLFSRVPQAVLDFLVFLVPVVSLVNLVPEVPKASRPTPDPGPRDRRVNLGWTG